MLEGKLGNLNRTGEVGLSLDREVLHAVEDLAKVWGGRYQHPWRLASHREHSHGVFGVGLRLGPSKQVDSICLSLKPGGRVVPIACPFTIVYTHYGSLHGGG